MATYQPPPRRRPLRQSTRPQNRVRPRGRYPSGLSRRDAAGLALLRGLVRFGEFMGRELRIEPGKYGDEGPLEPWNMSLGYALLWFVVVPVFITAAFVVLW